MDEYFKYFITTSSEDWSLDNFTEWCAVNVSCEKKKILDYMKKTMKESLKQSFSEDLKPKVIQMLEDFEDYLSAGMLNYLFVTGPSFPSSWVLFQRLQNLNAIRNEEAIQLAQIKSRETVQLAEIKSKNFEFHKNIAGDLVTIDHKRKMSPSDEYVEQEEYDMKPTSAESFKKRILNFDYSSESSIEERKDEAEDSEDPEDDILDFSNVTFDGWVETLNQSKTEDGKIKVNGKILSVIRLGLLSIIDLSSEFDKGMYTWFGEIGKT
ncbi:hypothetical protein RclHR1_02550023 [Rhizophagus clarus]|uniref:Uncharacterized protein n=1 Tax=Rhizophagus clarus TaxID=94130 RepID=A0A2Z6REZ9_9GLOM|nr:hypothetical protein RclHR1_02550023 [Rhizophagus clarus]